MVVAFSVSKNAGWVSAVSNNNYNPKKSAEITTKLNTEVAFTCLS